MGDYKRSMRLSGEAISVIEDEAENRKLKRPAVLRMLYRAYVLSKSSHERGEEDAGRYYNEVVNFIQANGDNYSSDWETYSINLKPDIYEKLKKERKDFRLKKVSRFVEALLIAHRNLGQAGPDRWQYFGTYDKLKDGVNAALDDLSSLSGKDIAILVDYPLSPKDSLIATKFSKMISLGEEIVALIGD